jgi:hypothetical protein
MFLDDTRLAAWTIDLVKTFWSLPDPVTVVSFDDAVSKNVLVDRFCIAIGCEGIRIPESNANATPRRTHEFSASLGVACKLMSLSRDIDINSEEIDIERQNAEDKFDLLRSKRAKYMDENVNEDFLDELIENSFNEYVEKCIECIPREDKYFYNDIVDSPMSWNYPKSMGGSGLRSIDNHMLKAQTIIS